MHSTIAPSEICTAIINNGEDRARAMLEEYLSQNFLKRLLSHVHDKTVNPETQTHLLGEQLDYDINKPENEACFKWLASLSEEKINQFSDMASFDIPEDEAEYYEILYDIFECTFSDEWEEQLFCELALRAGSLDTAEMLYERLKALDNPKDFENTAGFEFGFRIIGPAFENAPVNEREALLNNLDRFLARPAIAQHLKEHGNINAIISALTEETSMSDMVNDFLTHIILPATLLLIPEGQEKQNIISGNEMYKELSDGTLTDRPIAQALYHDISDIVPALRHTLSWHEPVNSFPSYLLPLAHDYEWYPVLRKPYQHPDGGSVECLTNSEALRDTGTELMNCLGRRYYERSCSSEQERDQRHILVVKNAEGQAVSSAEIKIDDEAKYSDYKTIPIAATGKFMHVIQHSEKKNAPLSPSTNIIFNAFLNDIENGKIALNLDKLGETEASKEERIQEGIPRAWQDIGCEPTWENVELAFNEFRKKTRAAYTGINVDGTLRVDESKPFISGMYKSEGQHPISLRELSCRDWLRTNNVIGEYWDTAERMKNGYYSGAKYENNIVSRACHAPNTPVCAITRSERDELMGDTYYSEMERWKTSEATSPTSDISPRPQHNGTCNELQTKCTKQIR